MRVLLVAVLIGATAMSMRQASLEGSQISKEIGSFVEVTAQVVTDPNMSTSGNYTFTARLLKFTVDNRNYSLRVPVRIISPRPISFLPGQSFSAMARVADTKESRVAVLLLVEGEFVVLTPPSRWASTLGEIRGGLRALSGEGDAGSLIPGMVLGDTSKQSSEFKEAMKRSGLTHLVAVSGANFAIVSSFVLWCMQFVFRRIQWRMGATAIALLCFIALVRPSPSVLRAAAMAAVLLSAQVTKRGRDSLPALGFAIAAVVIGDPWQSRDAGFALSVLATAGLLLFAPILIEKLPGNEKLKSALAPPIAAMIFCSPILVSLSGYLSPMSILANLLAAPFVAPITVFGFIAALISPFFPLIAQFLIAIIKVPATLIVGIAHWIADFPVLTIHSGVVGFSIVTAIFSSVWIFKKSRKAITSVLIILILSLTWIQRWPVADWEIANCNVGQGDSMVINLNHGRAIVIDVGPDPVAVDRCLKSLGITAISLLVLSHFHADHVAGLPGLLRSRTVDHVWISNNQEPILESKGALALLEKSKVVTAQKGLTVQLAHIRLEVIWPQASIGNFQNLPGEGSQINNSSIAMLVDSDNWSLFTAGDLEPPAQAMLINQVREVDIYKVSHHGSRYQDFQLMKALSPQLAVISVGLKNSYRHPSPETIASLTRLGAQVVRTDIDGAIAIQAQSHQLRVRKAKGMIRLFYWS